MGKPARVLGRLRRIGVRLGAARARHVAAGRVQVVIACGAVGILSIILLCWPVGCKHSASPSAPLVQERTMRVRVIEGVERVSVAASQPPIYFTRSDPTLRQLDLPRNVSVPV